MLFIIGGFVIIALVAFLFLTAAQGPAGNGGRLVAGVAMATFWLLIGMGLIGKGLGGDFWYAALAGLLLVPFLVVAINSPGLQKAIGSVIVAAFVGSVLVGFGIIPLNVRKSVTNAGTGVASNVAGTLNRVGLRSEGSVGMLDYTKEGGVVYASPNGTVYAVAGQELQVPANQQVRIMSTASENNMTQIMLQDSHRDFVSGIVCWIPNRRLKLQVISLKGLEGAFGKEKVRWDGVDEKTFIPDQPWKTVFTGLPAGEYRLVATGEYGLYVISRDGRTFHRRTRPSGEVLNDANQWTRHRAGSDCPVPGSDVGSLIYRVGGLTPRSYQSTFIVGDGRTADVELSVDIPHNNSRNFTENQGGLSVRVERKVTS